MESKNIFSKARVAGTFKRESKNFIKRKEKMEKRSDVLFFILVSSVSGLFTTNIPSFTKFTVDRIIQLIRKRVRDFVKCI